MQPYPQPPSQNMTLQRPWWLIYGLSFGAGLGLIDLVLSAFSRESSLGGYFRAFFFLLYFSACLVAGILVARKTHRAGSASLASLLIGLLFLLVEFILNSMHGIHLNYVLFIAFPVACLGVYVGFLGGLIGRTTERTRRTAGLFYASGVILVSAVVPFLVVEVFSFLNSVNNLLLSQSTIVYILSLMVLGSLCGMVAWILTLVQYAQAQSWGAFTLTLFFSGIMVLVYLIAGVQPRQPASYVVLPPGAYVPAASSYPPVQPVPLQPPQPDAVSLLQQRYARGEIDAETYRQMLATLTNSSANLPHQS